MSMRDVFNTTFEISLRMSLLFGVYNNAMTADRAAAYDFITIYSSSFNLSDRALNGENDFGFSEFAVRRDIITKALKNMIVDGLLTVHRDRSGFKYALTKNGVDFYKSLNSEYAEEYKTLARKTIETLRNTDDVKLLALITRESTKALRR